MRPSSSRGQSAGREVGNRYTPKHGSWLNMAEIELTVLAEDCLSQRIGSQAQFAREGADWQLRRNQKALPVNWRFPTEDARIKLKHLYP